MVATEGYLPTEKDFRPTLVRVRDANPDGLILISYYADAALSHARCAIRAEAADGRGEFGLFAKADRTGGGGERRVYASPFFPGDPRPEVQASSRFRAKYGQDPDTFNAISYDAMILSPRWSPTVRRRPRDGSMTGFAQGQGRAERDLRQGARSIPDTPPCQAATTNIS